MREIDTPIREVATDQPGALPAAVIESEVPVVVRGLVSHWPIVQRARESALTADGYFRSFYNGAPVTASAGPPEIKGRIFYNEDMTGFNFDMKRVALVDFLDRLLDCAQDLQPPLHYVGSTSVDDCLPGFRTDNDIELGVEPSLISFWVGNQSCIAAHYDIPDNIACVAIGRRRFTLFPPDQLENLYVGPLDFAPAGQAISLVDLRNPDFTRYPRFQEALKHAQWAELEPGDAIFIPSMWWHHVEGLDSYNLLINYWWRDVPAYMGSPADVLNHAFLNIRELPRAQREAWRKILDYYIFSSDAEYQGHIPESSRGVLAPLDDNQARKLRALLLKQLNR